jgi:2-polyprenyl-6-methoxyphenol hydroxylase-like FAD-dependent oxidoreductase
VGLRYMASSADNAPVHRVDRLLEDWRRTSPRRQYPPTLGREAHAVIVGAGPAGSFSAHFLRSYARERGLGLRMTVFDAKDFTKSGPAGCNMCAGVVASSLLRRMKSSGLSVPASVVQSRVNSFRLVTRSGSARLGREDPEHTMLTVFRGNGPRPGPETGLADASFDDALLRAVAGPDLTVVREPVTAIHPPGQPAEPVRVSFGRGKEKQSLEADVVIGAFGCDNRLGRKLAQAGVGYRPPQTVRACQAELSVGREHVSRVLGGSTQVFNLGLPDISFAAFVPKGDFVTCTIVGQRDLGLDDLLELLDDRRVRARLPRGWQVPRHFCHCHPSVVTSHARHPYTDRVVMVGDAASCRYYKNGIETAFDTAALAAFTATHIGVSAQAFGRYYARACDRLIERDNRFGRLLFAANRLIASHPNAARAFLVLCRASGAGAVGQRMQEVLWGLFAGDRPYREILRRALHPRVVWYGAWQLAFETLFRRHSAAARVRKASGRGRSPQDRSSSS